MARPLIRQFRVVNEEHFEIDVTASSKSQLMFDLN